MDFGTFGLWSFWTLRVGDFGTFGLLDCPFFFLLFDFWTVDSFIFDFGTFWLWDFDILLLFDFRLWDFWTF